MSIDYTWEDNSCGTEIKIECCIGYIYSETTKIKLKEPQLRDIYLLCGCWKNVATYKWKVHNEADLDISVISFISNSMETTF
jgi:hypothetical protein